MNIFLLSTFISNIIAQTGTFIFYENGRLIGEERYNIDGRMIESTVNLSNGYMFRQKTLFDIDGEPDIYVIDGVIKNEKVKIDIKRMNAKFAYTAISEKRGTEHFAVLTRAERHIILDNYVGSHLLSLISRINPTQKNELKIFTPQDGRVRDVIIEPGKRETITVDGKRRESYHLTFKFKKGRTVDLWIDVRSNSLVKYEIKELKLRVLHRPDE